MIYKGASTKNSCHARQILAVKRGLREFVKKGKFVTKKFFFQIMLNEVLKVCEMISADVKANKNNKK